MKLLSNNSPTVQEHQHQVLWQVIVPLILGVFIVTGLGICLSANSNAPVEIQKWSSVALIWLIVPALFMALIILITIVGITYMVTRLLGILPPNATIAQRFINQGKLKIEAGADAVVEPVLHLYTIWAGLQALYKRKEKK